MRRSSRATAAVAAAAVVAALLAPTAAQATPAEGPGPTTWMLSNLTMSGMGTESSAVVGNGGSLVLGGGWGYRSSSGERAEPHVTLERRVGSGSWTTTPAAVSFQPSVGFTVRTPPYRTDAAKQSVRYRLRSNPYTDPGTGGVVGTSTSASVRIVYENQARYRGFAKRVYRAAAPYCPSSAVHIQTLDPHQAGEYETGELLILVTGEVAAYPEIDVRAVALHECSHERQWLNYGGTYQGRLTMERAAAKYFAAATKPDGVSTPYRYLPPVAPIAPIEHAADCGAQSVNPGGYLGYGGYCTTSELRRGKRLMLGGRY